MPNKVQPYQKNNPKLRTKKKSNAGKPKANRNGGLFSLLFSTPFRQIIFIVIAIVLLTVFWDNVTDFGDFLLEQLGWGLAFILAFLITIIVLALIHRGGTFFRHWNRWLGIIGIVIVIWGILATVPHRSTVFPLGFGGNFGRYIISFPSDGIVYFFRLFVIALISILLIIPRPVFRGIKNVFLWIRDQFAHPAAPKKPVDRKVREAPAHRELQPPVKRDLRPAMPVKEPVADTGSGIDSEVLDSQRKLEELARRAEVLKAGAEKLREQPEKEKPAAPMMPPGGGYGDMGGMY